MITFHLVYIEDKYPHLKKIVYTFHMPFFLIISGYFFNIKKKTNSFFKGILWIFIPYAFMELGYVLMSSILPVREKVAEITLWTILDKVFISPMGPYWYLHTLVICGIVYYIVYNYIRLSMISRLIVLSLSLFIISYAFGMLSFANALYFIIGTAIHQSKLSFLAIFRPSALALIPLVILCSFPENLNKFSLSGIIITYLAVSLFLFLYNYTPKRIKQMSFYVGQNTLIILLFSPIFTILSKMFIPFFSFDQTGICFMCVAVIFTITGCIGIAKIIDWANLSRFCFGKEQILNKII